MDYRGQAYFADLDFKTSSGGVTFYLESINRKNTVYKRTSYYHKDGTTHYGFDTIEIPLFAVDSIYLKMPFFKNGRITSYANDYFVGWYNKKNNRIEGYLYPVTITMRCPYCPGKVYFTYTGKVPARIEPVEY